jgi:hypothetical protein
LPLLESLTSSNPTKMAGRRYADSLASLQFWYAVPSPVPNLPWSSGFPTDQNEELRRLGLSVADLQAIEHGNAARLIPRLKI